MAGTRTAPTVNGTETYLDVSFRMIDFDGTKRAINLKCETGTTNGEIEAVADALAAITNTSLFEIVVSEVYYSNPNSGVADNAVVQSAYSNVVIMFKDAPNLRSQEAYIPAPIDAIFVSGTKNVDLTNADYQAYRDAVDVVLGGGYTPISTRYTERRQMNQKTNSA